MAELQASYIQASSHPADTDRLVLEGLMNPAGAPVSGAAYGVGQAANDLKVQAKGTPNMSVDVLSGHAWIDGTEGANQGTYHVYNDATKNLVISAAHATLPRKDLVVAKVQDAAYSGAVNAWSLAVVTGTPASPALEPAVPANAIVLALVDVAALAASIVNGNITDRRRRASGLGGIVVCTSATRPAAPYTGQITYETDTDRPVVWDGSGWKPLSLKGDPPACRVSNSGAISIAHTTLTTVTWDTEAFDTDTMHSTVSNTSRITFNTAGLYYVSAAAELATGTDYTLVDALIRLNGSTYVVKAVNGTQTASDDSPNIEVSTLYKFAAGDYIEAILYQKNGASAARNLLAASANIPNYFAALWVGRG